MRLEHLFYDEISHKNVAFRAKLKCTCGCNSFSITHSGRLIKLLGNNGADFFRSIKNNIKNDSKAPTSMI